MYRKNKSGAFFMANGVFI